MTYTVVSPYVPRKKDFIPKYSFGEDSPAPTMFYDTKHGFGRLEIHREFGPSADVFKLGIWNMGLRNADISRSMGETNLFDFTVFSHVQGKGYRRAEYLCVINKHPRYYHSDDSGDSCVIFEFTDITHHALTYSPEGFYGEPSNGPPSPATLTTKQLFNTIVNQATESYLKAEGAENVYRTHFRNIALSPNDGKKKGILFKDTNGMGALLRCAAVRYQYPMFIHIGSANINMQRQGTARNKPHLPQYAAGMVAAFKHPYEFERGSPDNLRRNLFNEDIFDMESVWHSPIIDDVQEGVTVIPVEKDRGAFIMESRLNPELDPGVRLRFGGKYTRDMPGGGGVWNGRIDSVSHYIMENGVSLTRALIARNRTFPRAWL